MIPTIIKDDLPRQIAYPIGASILAGEIGEIVPFDRLGVYMLFTSGSQIDYYDPITSRELVYPVLALDRSLPPLRSNVAASLQAPLHDAAITVFPVKARVRKRVAHAIVSQGMRPIRNWLSALYDAPEKSRALVLIYDQKADRLISKFVERADGEPRHYC